MISDERRKRILELLAQHNYMSVEKLAREIFVSEPTIRRDLTQLAKEGSLKRTRGGAKFVNPDTVDWPFIFRQKENLKPKQHIAEMAVRLVHDQDTLFLDSGSTCYCLARELLDKKSLSILTYGMENAKILASNETFNSQITCGTYQSKRTSIYGFQTIEYIRQFHMKWCFLSAPGFHPVYGISNYDAMEAEIKKAMHRNAEHTVLLLDHKKIGKGFEYCELSMEDIDVIITDKPMDDEVQRACNDHDICVISSIEQMYSYTEALRKDS